MANVGGAANAGGIAFQECVTAWLFAHVLAEKHAPALWGSSSAAVTQKVWCETAGPVDDILVQRSDGGFSFIQVKRSLAVESSETSELAKAIGQLVRQFLTNCGARQAANPPWRRPLVFGQDSLVLVVGSTSPGTVRDTLKGLFDRARNSTICDPVSALAQSKKAKQILDTLLDHIRRTWTETVASAPSDRELHDFLRLVHVAVLDVENSGTDAQQAETLLRSGVLHESTEAITAWALLTRHAHELMQQQGSADIHTLRQLLHAANVATTVTPSYRADIDKLRALSTKTIDGLADFASIRGPNGNLATERTCQRELNSLAAQSSVVIVGEPGAGKSGVLHSLATTLRDSGADLVCVAVNDIAAESPGALRSELGLMHDLVDVLQNWDGISPAYLLVDALDAARNERTADVLRGVIQLLSRNAGRWRVVATIRKFDLRYSQALQSIFSGAPSGTYCDPEFPRVRHLNVRRLDDNELRALTAQAPALATLVQQAPQEFRVLLTVPFNLRLVAELLQTGVSENELTPARTQQALLDKYWAHRVLGSDPDRDQREYALRTVCDAMIRNKSLATPRSAVDGSCLDALLSNGVLVERTLPSGSIDRYTLSFAHHVLFDYAVACLVMRRNARDLAQDFANDPELPLIVTPSLRMHFEHLWEEDRPGFWELAFALADSALSPLVQLIGPSIFTARMHDRDDDTPLIQRLSVNGDEGARARTVLDHVVGSILTDQSQADRHPLVGDTSPPWTTFMMSLVNVGGASLANHVRVLLYSILDQLDQATTTQGHEIGETARALLGLARTHFAEDRRMLQAALRGVCRTFATAPAESATLLRFAFASETRERVGYIELPVIADEVEHLVREDPVLCADLYDAVFSWTGPSDEPTVLLSSAVMPQMLSNKRQDYDQAKYSLATKFPLVLRSNLVFGVRALLKTIGGYAHTEHAETGPLPLDEFDLVGRRARYRGDLSFVWDSNGTHEDDDALCIMNHFHDHVRELDQAGDLKALERILQVVAEENELAVVWRRLLDVGRKCSPRLAEMLVPLVCASPVLLGRDTTTHAGDFLRGSFEKLDTSHREKVERAITGLQRGDSSALPQRNRVVARLLCCIPRSALQTAEARQVVDEIYERGEPPRNDPPFTITMGWGSRSEEEDLSERGIDVAMEANQSLIAASGAVQEFVTRHNNEAPSQETISEVMPALRVLRELLSTSSADKKLRDDCWGHLAAACKCIARAARRSFDEATLEFVRSTLLDAGRNDAPFFDENQEAQFAQGPFWGSPSARIDAAQGAIALARFDDGGSNELWDAIETLGLHDQVSAVRFQIAAGLYVLYSRHPDLFWRLATWYAENEPNPSVATWFVSPTLRSTAGREPDRTLGFIGSLLSRFAADNNADTLRKNALGLVSVLWMHTGNANARAKIDALLSEIDQKPGEARLLVHPIRGMFTYDRGQPGDSGVRERALRLACDLVVSAQSALDRLIATAESSRNPQASKPDLKPFAAIIGEVAQDVYFASGAFDQRTSRRQQQNNESSSETMRRFYREAHNLMDALATTGLPEAAHRLVEAMTPFVDDDPQGVLLRTARAVSAADKWGYATDTLAASVIVGLVERYLADHRGLLRQHQDCRKALLDLLNMFVRAGWPSARRLVYRLEEVFR